MMTPLSQMMGPPENPARFSSCPPHIVRKICASFRQPFRGKPQNKRGGAEPPSIPKSLRPEQT
ncbi:hypothetical protein ABTG83_19800, partial [Acinetobacter baumannii]